METGDNNMKFREFYVKCVNSSEWNHMINEGKVYIVKGDYDECYLVIDDNNNERYFHKSRFVRL